MKSNTLLALLGAAVCGAQHIDLAIPQTELYVNSMLSRFAAYTKGPKTPSGMVTSVKPGSKTATSEHAVATHVPTHEDASCAFWMETYNHQGVAAFNSASGYSVFRNVKNYGAKGDGVTDDTAAIQAAISAGGRSGPASGITSTNQPAVVYLPAGTYLISKSILDYYYTSIIGNPNCMPVLKATASFSGFGLIDGNQYQSSGNLGWTATNVFFRQVRNIVFDMTNIAGGTAATGIHWPTAQATSLQNCVFQMSSASGTQHQGVFIENGSGGWATDLTFNGGLYGLNVGNQQFTMRNLVFNNCVTAISQIWDWGWTYSGLSINNCKVGLDITSGSGSSAGLSVAGVVVIDSTFSNTPVGIRSAHETNSSPSGSGSIVLENVVFSNVGTAVQDISGSTDLAGSSGSMTVAGWAQGHSYTPNGPTNLQGTTITANSRPAALLSGGKYYTRSKPQYSTLALSSFLSARSQGAKGDGVTDDTAALQKAINAATSAGQVLVVDAGTYRVTSTILIPAGAKIVGESYSVIMSSGATFNNGNAPTPVVKIGNSGGTGSIEWSDMIVATQGQQAGAILIEYNLASPSGTPSGIWDVHTRIGGFIGSNVEGNTCGTTPGTSVGASNVNKNCIGAYMSMHITPGGSGLYMENNWFWTADHDIDANDGGNQVTIYTGRGLLCESKTGTIWLYGTAVEHHALYQYQFLNTQNVFAGQIQTETPYYQPNPDATIPFTANSSISDPTFNRTPYTTGTNGVSVPNAEAWGLRVLNSKSVLVYGAGHYSFFNNYSTSCSNQGNDSVCQSRIVSLDSGSTVSIYDLHTVGTRVMLQKGTTDVIDWSANQAGFSEEVIVFKSS